MLANFWQESVRDADVVTIFGVDNVMQQVAQKLESELQPGAIVISNIFRIPKWKPSDMKNDLWMYDVRHDA